ncbi:hypothetical protein Asppvi_000986 [Aspergillus pseudoviridinutans]|uniref:Uncharacterized protein n=1 Tax=Aspergillus pseudoviridinutans TaxID=1517512 RepID=A0A9P3EQX5_9EURO|nr:uncharacterized protein Asppvi_000986 [Aspergillus pseudoviridinutans]GIJ82478.1 hypothetical protein Asppvi_000986 [Aspergillus pseudoviridinutans]
MATTRLRKAFRYPDDSGDDEQGREELDEEEQDLVIRQLQAKNDKRNSEYTVNTSLSSLTLSTQKSELNMTVHVDHLLGHSPLVSNDIRPTDYLKLIDFT